MSAVNATNTYANSAIASLVKDAASSGTTTASQGSTPSSSSAPSASSTDPTDTVDLSDRAKNPDSKDTSKAKMDDRASLFDKLSGRTQTQTSGDTQWVAGAPYGNALISDADFTKELKGGGWNKRPTVSTRRVCHRKLAKLYGM